MANKDLKTRTPISNAVDTKLLAELKTYSKETGIPLSKLLDKAIQLLLESVKK
ncbi:ribbon-helix-helix domain-containing protein [Peptoclostridium acidaminophilum]|nr:ribbon-helix-helix domain-containing protein [Peptoclostridium acidaminophilum]